MESLTEEEDASIITSDVYRLSISDASAITTDVRSTEEEEKKNQLGVRPTNLLLKLLLLLPFLVTMAIYTVDTKALESVILRFQPHHDTAKFPFIHQTLNSAYGLDLYESECEFISHDVPTNGLTELYKDAPQRLLNHMIAHIQTESGATSRSETEKVEKLFKTMLLSYKMGNCKYSYFKRGQELTSAI